MKTFQTLIPAFTLVAAAQAWESDWNNVTTTITTDIYTTYCPSATTFSMGTHTYTATASETIVITDCPCTYVTTESSKSSSWVASSSGNATTAPTVSPTKNATSIPPTWITTTETVATYTTYCPVPTTVVQGSSTYTVSVPTTLTITNCPCTEVTSYPAITTYCPAPTTITYNSQTYPVTTSGYVTIPLSSVPGVVPVGPTATMSSPVQVTNAAAKKVGGVGALAAAGLAMLL